ncbi:Rap1a/Tai family immunity protein [Scandinavium goeteborgense]|uniref:Rap1a immunity protein domain-containing protein n=1 Tax=Scandinavium goeteborgense TaxID=1851514 RepID=A0A4V3BMQ4_SCAGO|nr:Rap1a/Tai family immunity protein [Scandinavium goeteborgense]TDN51482.1 hypothetical protein EC847_11811 [Scandinavium goeteborgense]
MVKFYALSIAAAMFFCSTVSFAGESTDGVSVQGYLTMKNEASKGQPLAEDIISITTAVILDSFMYSNAAMDMDTGENWFCSPKNVELTGVDVEHTVDAYIKMHPEKVKPSDRDALIAVLAFREKYPCKK